jgi:hypothetical protein
MLWFTKWYSPQDNQHWFVPLPVKCTNPSLWGNILNRQNTFLSNHRNISIIGISTDVMDYLDPTLANDLLSSSLWQELWEHTGINVVFSHIRTPDLGKWNLSTTADYYPDVCTWLDVHLPAKFAMIPTKFAQKVTFKGHAQPECMRCTCTDSSIVSGLTTRSNTTAYSNHLLATFGTSKDPLAAPNAWRPPPTIDSVNYHFNPKDFPKLALPPGPAAEASPSEPSPTVISNVTHSLISQSVANSIAAWEAKHIAREQGSHGTCHIVEGLECQSAKGETLKEMEAYDKAGLNHPGEVYVL